MHKKKNDSQGDDIAKMIPAGERHKNKIKFTKAGFPIHDYLKELREDREKRDYRRSLQVRADPRDAQKYAHLKKSQNQAPVDILKNLQDEMEQERKEMEERLKHGGIESLQEDERLKYETQIAMEEDNRRIKGIVAQLIGTDMQGIDSRQFEQYKHDDSLMDEWTKQLIEDVLVEY